MTMIGGFPGPTNPGGDTAAQIAATNQQISEFADWKDGIDNSVFHALFYYYGLNKFDPEAQTEATIADNAFIDSGTVTPNENYYVSAPIYLEPSQAYTLTREVWGSASGNSRGTFFDASNVKTGVVSGASFVTPPNTSYVRFTVRKPSYPLEIFKDKFMVIKGTSLPPVYIPYKIDASTYASYFSSVSRPIYVIKSANLIDVISKYNSNNDVCVTLGNRGPNNLFEFNTLALISNQYSNVSTSKSAATTFFTNTTDFFGPYIMKAVNTADGDLPASEDFTGGVHAYSGSSEGTPTARTSACIVKVDGRTVGDTYEGYANYVDIIWTNLIQATNTKKSDGTGREVLSEKHRLHFDGALWSVSNEIVALEDVDFYKHYGLQCLQSIWGQNNKIYYKGSDAVRGPIAYHTDSTSGDKKCYKMLLSGAAHSLEFGITPELGLGNYSKNAEAYSAMTAGYKNYFNLIRTSGSLPRLLANEMFYYEGYYKFFPTE